MKYGLLMYNCDGNHNKNKNDKYYINLGDNMQTFAIENLYRKMNIKDSEIVRIYYNEIGTYKGEYIILPMNMFGSKKCNNDIFPTSPYIIPLFIGFNYSSSKCIDYSNYFKKYEPIGCRDEYTLNIMREAGIEAYFSGCMTITLPVRKKCPSKNKIFMVDTPTSLEKYIPNELKDNIEYITHEIEVDEPILSDEKVKKINDYARKLMERYKNEATLVVTSRLHCAAPCLAMGIPVIIVKENIDINLSWIDKFVKIYSLEMFEEIDWNQNPVNVEDIKDKIFRIFEKQINSVFQAKKDIYELSTIYETRQKSQYNNSLSEKLIKNMEKLDKDDLKYVIWGTGAGGTLAYQLIKEKYPKFKMVMAVDTYDKGYFWGIEIKHPDELKKYTFDYIFICTYSGRYSAIAKMKELEIEENKYYMFLLSKVINKHKGIKKNFY